MPAAWMLCALLAQAAGQRGQEAADPARIRKALDSPPPSILSDAVQRQGDVFRVTIRALPPEKPARDDWSHVPSYVRPWWKGDHYEFLEQVTDERFRTGTLYPVGVPIIPIVEWIAKQIGTASYNMKSRKAREEVRRELERFLACRADPSKPPC